ncbi:MAG: methyltransferase domain-containing protein [Alphaproteobacteria bacterium]|jgi:predicted membrane-bound spermidine synthase|nr:methyltransferase domain-containing protein [Alphaproteobacteria bacterium]
MSTPAPASDPAPPPARPAGRLTVYATILVTGAATLALELIASRLLTPYVGGGLIVWTAILSVTLLALAGGYHCGSRWSARDVGRRFVLLPAAAALVLALTGALYPALLPVLTAGDALAGAFVGALLVLTPALVLLSAMGPLGIALIRTGEGDAGAGEIFAVSTVGSVLGVLIGAFGLLPFMAPAAALYVLALALAVVAAGAAWRFRAPQGLIPLLPAVLAAGGLGGAALGGGPEAVDYGPYRFAHVATARSPQATIIVVEGTHRAHQGRVRLYLEENQIQSARGFGLPGSPMQYVAISQALIAASVPRAGRVLVLGLAGGMAASHLARAGHAVEAVEINARAVDVARRWFDLAPEVAVTVGDARRFVDGCGARYDAIFVDVFSGLHTPEHLVTREFFAAAAGCLAPGGVIVVNAVVPPLATRPARRLVAALAAAAGTDVAVYQHERGEAGRHNRVLWVRPDGGAPPTLALPEYPVRLFAREAREIAPQVVGAAALAGVTPLRDAGNDFALSLALTAPAPPGIPVPAQWY